MMAGAQFISNPALDIPTVKLVGENPDVAHDERGPDAHGNSGGMESGRRFREDISLLHDWCGDTYIRALRRPFPDIPLIAGGGVTQQNAAHYLLAGACALSVGKELIPRESMLLHKPDRIRELTRRFAAHREKHARPHGRSATAQVAQAH